MRKQVISFTIEPELEEYLKRMETCNGQKNYWD